MEIRIEPTRPITRPAAPFDDEEYSSALSGALAAGDCMRIGSAPIQEGPLCRSGIVGRANVRHMHQERDLERQLDDYDERRRNGSPRMREIVTLVAVFAFFAAVLVAII